MTTVWNTADKSSAITLSDDDHRATSNPGNGNGGVRATLSHDTGKWYLEFPDIDTGGFGFGAGLGPSSYSLTDGNQPEFRIGTNGGVNTPSGSSYATIGATVTGTTIGLAVDLDANLAWFRVNGTWYGTGGGADPATGTAGYSLASRSANVFPAVWLQFNTCHCDINCGDRPFDYAAPAGFDGWDAPAPPTPRAFDGTEILEATFYEVPSTVYSEADYHSIWSRGDRVANGLISATGQYGWNSVSGDPANLFNNNFGAAAGDSFDVGAGPHPGASSVWWTFGESSGVPLVGVMWYGATSYTISSGVFTLVGGIGPGSYFPSPYHAGFDQFNIAQSTLDSSSGNYYRDLSFTARFPVPFPHYEIVISDSGVTSGGKIAQELWFKVRHSVLDGGDRRSSNGRPEKRCTIVLSSDWAYRNDATHSHPNDSLLDGQYDRQNSNDASTKNGNKCAELYKTGGTAAQDIVGAWIEFQFPREVSFDYLLLNVTNQQEEYDSGDEPVHYGIWHWEFSKNGGLTWTPIGDPWSFRPDCYFMLAPRELGGFNASFIADTDGLAVLGDGAARWRMVLDQGPAFGNTCKIAQAVFQLRDFGGTDEIRRIDFTDDTDGVPATLTVVAGGSPYVVALTDGNDDKLTGTLSILPNAIITGAFSDGPEDGFEAFGDFYPSIYPQTVLVTTGK